MIQLIRRKDDIIQNIIKTCIYFLITIQINSNCIGWVESSSAMKRLYEDLFTDYNRLILPVARNKTKVRVSMGLKLGQILDLNLKQQILSTNVWVEQTWHDYKLEWEPEMYDGIDMIHVPAENIWIPDIVLFNNADGNYELTLVAKARVYYNGTVIWRPPTMFRSTCEIDVEYFPFDIQTCYLRFGSWTYAGDEVELSLAGGNKTKISNGIDLSQFYKNVEWDIIEVTAYYNENQYDCCPEPYPDITFEIVIRRKILFYLVNLILPVALMTFLTVSVFYLPSDSNEKVTMSISILTSLIVFFLLMLEIIPASSLAVPLFGKYLLFTLILVSSSACVSVFVLNMHHRSPTIHSMSPRWRHIFLKTLPKYLLLNQPDPRERSSLNRFRQKKIAQQLLKQAASPTNKVYDLAQPMAASLNLIETLHKSYHFDAVGDANNLLQKKDVGTNGIDDEGRYFRRYIDEYITQLKKRQQQVLNYKQQTQNNIMRTSSFYARPNIIGLPTIDSFSIGNERSTDLLCPPGSSGNQTGYSPSWAPNTQTRSLNNTLITANASIQPKNNLTTHLGLLNDDTLDMTFDYDDQQDNNNNNNNNNEQSNIGHSPLEQVLLTNRKEEHGAGCDELPSPPPPPRELSQISRSGRNSSCSRTGGNATHINDDYGDIQDDIDGPDVDNSSKLVEKLNLINDLDVDTTTTPSANDDDDAFETPSNAHHQSTSKNNASDVTCFACLNNQAGKPVQQTKTFIRPSLLDQHQQGSSSSRISDYGPHLNRDFLPEFDSKPSELLLSLRLPYERMPPHVRAAIRSVLFIADTIKNEDDENSAVEDWQAMSMVVDRLFFYLFFFICTIGSFVILLTAPALYDARLPIDDQIKLNLPPPSKCAEISAIHGI